MTPRVDVVGLDATRASPTCWPRPGTAGTSRFPVYERRRWTRDRGGIVVDALAIAPADREATLVGAIAREPCRSGEPRPRRGAGSARLGPGALAIVVDEYAGRRRRHIEDLVEELSARSPTSTTDEEGADDINGAGREPSSTVRSWSTACSARTSWRSRPVSGRPRPTRRWPAI